MRFSPLALMVVSMLLAGCTSSTESEPEQAVERVEPEFDARELVNSRWEAVSTEGFGADAPKPGGFFRFGAEVGGVVGLIYDIGCPTDGTMRVVLDKRGFMTGSSTEIVLEDCQREPPTALNQLLRADSRVEVAVDSNGVLRLSGGEFAVFATRVG